MVMQLPVVPWKAVLSLSLVANFFLSAPLAYAASHYEIQPPPSNAARSSTLLRSPNPPSKFQIRASESLIDLPTPPEANRIPIGLDNDLKTRSDTSDEDYDNLCSSSCDVCATNNLPEPPGLINKRSYGGPSRQSFTSIFHRALPDPSGTSDYARWLFEEFKGATLVPKGLNNKATSSYEEFNGQASKMGVINLYGCTSVVVVSKYASYASHIYQPWFVGTIVTQEEFQEVVLDWLKNDPKLNNPSFTSSDASPYAIIISPGRTNGRDPLPGIRYQARVDDISETLSSFLPLTGPAKQQAYINVRKPDISDESLKNGFSFPHGKVLIAYDPNSNDSESCDDMKNGVGVWTGDSTDPIYTVTW
ncbi:hypothetical protein N7474_003381 [Penicillium riverlandense]|uniref:uncharacterized protein n=1 Tax=Penicillium riverlandense TaxID=1903569 RepID=UPI00254873A0|nr:uncharacterized protein N7474_003381 [Penicillium riverlandense]KAJ5826243.1 hypothetical protein N7474_003381 [Penicillium riverlandense]